MAGRKHTHGTFSFKIEQSDNGSLIASIVHEPHRPPRDDVGALYYVVVVILIYGCSILMMIASYIRKNKIDQKLHRYLKEMANVRKREQQLQLFQAARKAAEISARNSVRDVSKPTQDLRKCSQASDFSDIEEIVIEHPGNGEGVNNLLSDVSTPTTPLAFLDGSRSPAVTGHRKGSLNTVRIVCEDGLAESEEHPLLSHRPEGDNMKTVTVFEPKTGKTLKLCLRQGGPGGSNSMEAGSSEFENLIDQCDEQVKDQEEDEEKDMDDEELEEEEGEEEEDEQDEEDEEVVNDDISDTSSHSGSFTFDCQISTSV